MNYGIGLIMILGFNLNKRYPLGRVVGGTVYPGLMSTAALIHWIL